MTQDSNVVLYVVVPIRHIEGQQKMLTHFVFKKCYT